LRVLADDQGGSNPALLAQHPRQQPPRHSTGTVFCSSPRLGEGIDALADGNDHRAPGGVIAEHVAQAVGVGFNFGEDEGPGQVSLA